MDRQQIGAWFKRVLANMWHWLGRIQRRFQLVRWFILLVLTLVLALSAYFTYQAKTANVENIKSSLQTKTTLYDEDNKRPGHCTRKARTWSSTRFRPTSKTR